MCNNGVCAQHPGEQEFAFFNETLGPDHVIFPAEAGQGENRYRIEKTRRNEKRYGVMVHRSAWQWEIVAVEAGHTRHVAFVSPTYRLEQVVELARGMERGAAPLACREGALSPA